ncbi:MAG: putative CRISPR-associated protein, partial [Thermoproteota archaeon]
MSVRWVHVISVGTSILRNFSRDQKNLCEKLDICNWGTMRFDDPDQQRALTAARRGDPIFDTLYEYVSKNHFKASAELNAFLRAVSRFKHSPPKDVSVYLFSSNSGTGYLCASLIHEFLRSLNYTMLRKDPIRIEYLGKNLQSFEDSLVDLVEKVVNKILEWNSKGIKVYLNLTGGFKPESTFLALAGALAGAQKAYYIHETFDELVTVPLLKLAIDHRLTNLIKRLEDPYKTFSEPELEDLLRGEGLNLEDLRERGFIEEEKPAFRKYLIKLA